MVRDEGEKLKRSEVGISFALRTSAMNAVLDFGMSYEGERKIDGRGERPTHRHYYPWSQSFILKQLHPAQRLEHCLAPCVSFIKSATGKTHILLDDQDPFRRSGRINPLDPLDGRDESGLRGSSVPSSRSDVIMLERWLCGLV